jgi:hypothetical protein
MTTADQDDLGGIAESLLLEDEGPADTGDTGSTEADELALVTEDEGAEPNVPGDEDGEYGDPAEQDDTDDGDDEGNDDDEPATLYTVKIDGEERQVSLDDLTRSFAGQGYIQKRMQEVAGQKREAEQVYAAVLQERAELAALRAQLNQQNSLLADPTPPDRALLATDPIGYLEAEVAYRDAVEQRHRTLQQQHAQQAEQQQRAMMAHAATLEAQKAELTRRLPVFADAKKAGETMQALSATGAEYGYTPAEMAALVDARAAHVLHDAMQWRRQQAARAGVDAKLAQARPVVRPGSKPAEGTSRRAKVAQSRAQMKQTGSVDDVAAYLLA